MCIFCKIGQGEIPSYKVYEDDNFLAFMDLSQATIGHTLVIPKKHYDSIFDLDDGKIFDVVIKIAKGLKEALHLEGVNILNNSGQIAGQSVNHFHIHIIPRYNNDSVVINFSKNELSTQEFISLANNIKNSIK